MAQPRFKSEVFVPIRNDDHSFEERQKNIWEDMHERMERRRREWEDEVGHMRSDFFRLKPTEMRRGSSENLLESRNMSDIFYDDKKGGDKKFRVSFDVSQFQPDEISVRTENQKLIVHAKHEEKGGAGNIQREFSRQIDIPKHVDPDKLQSTLSNDGILQVEAPVPAPAYNQIQDTMPSSSMMSRPLLGASPKLQSGPVVVEEDGSRKFKISVDIGSEFTSSDIMVKTVDKKLLINAKHEEKVAGRTSCKEFSREFDLPEDVDPNLVTASMADDGKLLVEAPISTYRHGSYTGRPGSTKQPTVTIQYGK